MPVLITSTSPTTSQTLNVNRAVTAAFQLSVEGSGSIASQAVIEGSHDGKGWINIATLNASGTGYAMDGGPFETHWPLMRGRIISVTGTATLYFNL